MAVKKKPRRTLRSAPAFNWWQRSLKRGVRKEEKRRRKRSRAWKKSGLGRQRKGDLTPAQLRAIFAKMGGRGTRGRRAA